MALRNLVNSWVALALILVPRWLHAQVIEPNGRVVPNLTGTPTETSLQEYFDAELEGIDAVMEASAEPGVFSPQCNFTAALVLNQGSPDGGIAWYNVPANPTAAPAVFYTIVPTGTPVGQSISSADIRMHPDYAGGSIGFVLVKNFGRATYDPVYYSEFQRNRQCTDATACPVGGHWKMMLAYRSKLDSSAYYLAFEDWEGANEQGWQGNDGDFNDKVFRISGVSCAGGGVPCETGKIGLCAAGLTDCQVGGELVCKQQAPERPETCDDVDNDCNGEVDDGDLCPPGEVCVRGKCVSSCSTGEFVCPLGLVCDDSGYCIDPECANVQCEPGMVCRGGDCVAACSGVSCPLGQICQLGSCIDPCAGVECSGGTVCSDGVCVGNCSCTGCSGALVCATDGRCVEDGCDSVSCGPAEGCVAGVCVDACRDAVCPGGAACTDGSCGDPLPGTAGTTGSGGGSGGSINIGSGTGQGANAGRPSGTAGRDPTSGSGGGSDASRSGADSGCGCRVPARSRTEHLLALAAACAAALTLASRRRRWP